jgi:hypothetical protein
MKQIRTVSAIHTFEWLSEDNGLSTCSHGRYISLLCGIIHGQYRAQTAQVFGRWIQSKFSFLSDLRGRYHREIRSCQGCMYVLLSLDDHTRKTRSRETSISKTTDVIVSLPSFLNKDCVALATLPPYKASCVVFDTKRESEKHQSAPV